MVCRRGRLLDLNHGDAEELTKKPEATNTPHALGNEYADNLHDKVIDEPAESREPEMGFQSLPLEIRWQIYDNVFPNSTIQKAPGESECLISGVYSIRSTQPVADSCGQTGKYY